MKSLFHTTFTSRRHRELGYCEESDFGTIQLLKLKPEEKKLIVSFTDFETKKEFIEFEGYVYSKHESVIDEWAKKQGRFSTSSAIKYMLELRKNSERSFSYVNNSNYILIGKTLYSKYSELKDLTITVCSNMLFANWISINIESHSGKRNIKLSKSNFEMTVKEEVAFWKKCGNPNNTNIHGDIHSCFSKPTNLKWGESFKK